MKKLYVMFSVVLVSMFVFISCSKELSTVSDGPTKVGVIAGQITVDDYDLTFKSAPVTPIGVTRIWYMYKKDIIAPSGWSLVNGDELVAGSAGDKWWKTPGNNPITFSVSESLYSNFTPMEDLRIVTKTLNADKKVAYIGIHDFHPTANLFPLNFKGKRMGDALTINIDDLTSMPGYTFAVSVAYKLSTIDIDATTLGTSTTDAGWPILKYSVENVATTANITGGGQVTVYEGLDKKVVGNIVVTIKIDNITTITKTVPALELGKGLALILKSDKVGTVDSKPIGLTDDDITIETQTINIDQIAR